MEFDATFWVGFCFVVFVGLMIYLKVHKMLIAGLDQRSEQIRERLDEAQRLREEAQALLASYERKQRDAVKEAEAMVEHARAEAQREREQAEARLEEMLTRREALAVEKIALAEVQARQEIRDVAIEAAIAAARRVIVEELNEERASALVDGAIGDLRRNLN